MPNDDPINKISDSRISQFVRELRGIHSHSFRPGAWDDLRNGSYLGGPTESQTNKRGSGGLGLVSERLSDEEWDEAWQHIAAIRKQNRISENLEGIKDDRLDAHIDGLFEDGFGQERRLNKLAEKYDRLISGGGSV
jgi:hypothetical protein